MAIITTCKVSVYAPIGRINQVVELLHKSGLMEPLPGDKSLAANAEKSISSELKRADEAIAVLAKYRPPGFLKHKSSGEKIGYRIDEKVLDAARELVGSILDIESRKRELKVSLDAINARRTELSELDGFSLGTLSEETESTRARALVYSGKNSAEICTRLDLTDIYYEIIKIDKRRLFLWAVYLKRDEAEAEALFSDLRLTPPKTQLAGMSPEEEKDKLLFREKQLLSETYELEKQLLSLTKNRKTIERYYDWLLLKRGRYTALLGAKNTEKVLIITGYVPKEKADELISLLKKEGAAAEIEEPLPDEILPVAFKNNELVSPVEEVTASYSMPGAGDIDPNPIMAVFYYWFFGMMFSDAGYGILMMAVCGVLGYSKLLANRKMYQMFFWCGLSTTLWGLLYGSFFGDLIGVVSKTFGNAGTEFRPILIDPVNQALELLIISVVFGLIHIEVALIIQLIKLWKRGDKTAAVCDVGSWIIILLGGALFAAGAFLNIEIIKITGIILILFGAIILVTMSGRDKKNLLGRVFSGILSLYDITSYVGDILSYSRLMALGLATGVIASVVNVLASLGGGTPLGAVVFVLVSVLGHSLNFAINMLGAYVHTNRLQYVEFYQKFYEGGGVRFKPMRPQTKYFSFLPDEE